MTDRHNRIGLHIIKDGKNIETDTFPEFVRKVEAAAAKPKRGNPKGSPGNLLKRTDGEFFWPIREDRQCVFIHTKGDKAGQRCGAWAMRGGTRCARHGGYREQPGHKATIRRLGIIQAQHARSLANKQLRRSPPKIRQQVETTLEHEGLPLSPVTILQGIDALQTDDNGKAWRRFIAHAKAAAPTQEPNARKTTLNSRKPSQKDKPK